MMLQCNPNKFLLQRIEKNGHRHLRHIATVSTISGSLHATVFSALFRISWDCENDKAAKSEADCWPYSLGPT